jgi:hypothetical protein
MHDSELGERLATHLRSYAAVMLVVLPLSFSVQAHSTENGFVIADARTYRHCHNAPTRTYCHKKDALPMNWPPFSDSHRKKPEKQIPCKKGSGECADHSQANNAKLRA